MFPVACMHCILATKVVANFFLNDVCIKKSLEWKRRTQLQKNKLQNDLSSWRHQFVSPVYEVNQIFEFVSDSFAKKKDMLPTYGICVWVGVCECSSSSSVDKKEMRIAVFCKKMENKKCISHSSFWTCYWEHFFLFWPKNYLNSFFFFFFSKFKNKKDLFVCLHSTSVWRKAMRDAQFTMISSGQKLKNLKFFLKITRATLKTVKNLKENDLLGFSCRYLWSGS